MLHIRSPDNKKTLTYLNLAKDIKELYTVKANISTGVVSSNKDTGVTIYQDAAGGLVFSGLSVPSIATEEQ